MRSLFAFSAFVTLASAVAIDIRRPPLLPTPDRPSIAVLASAASTPVLVQQSATIKPVATDFSITTSVDRTGSALATATDDSFITTLRAKRSWGEASNESEAEELESVFIQSSIDGAVHRYQNASYFAAGNDGILYKAVDEHNRNVVLKTTRDNDRWSISTFNDELAVYADLARKYSEYGNSKPHPLAGVYNLDNPNKSLDQMNHLIELYDNGTIMNNETLPVAVFEQGHPIPCLANWRYYSDMQDKDRIRSIATIAHQMISALQLLHTSGYIHGDFHTGNMIYNEDTLVLIDFGLTVPIDKDRELIMLHRDLDSLVHWLINMMTGVLTDDFLEPWGNMAYHIKQLSGPPDYAYMRSVWETAYRKTLTS